MSMQIDPEMSISPSQRVLGVSACWAMFWREGVRFLRQRSRVVGALLTPIVFWLVLGLGLDNALVVTRGEAGQSDVGYLGYFLPGAVLMLVLFTAIFSTITVIEDRKAGFLQGVLVSPVGRGWIVLGKALAGAALATGQAVIMMLAWPMVLGWPSVLDVVLAIGACGLVALQLTALGLLMAWPMQSTAGFHAIMNVFLMPMWLVSGAVFPMGSAPGWMQTLMWVNPLSHGQALLARIMLGPTDSVVIPWAVALVVTIVVTGLLMVGVVRVAGRNA